MKNKSLNLTFPTGGLIVVHNTETAVCTNQSFPNFMHIEACDMR